LNVVGPAILNDIVAITIIPTVIRSERAQFATSLLANHKFWLVPPFREKAASAVQRSSSATPAATEGGVIAGGGKNWTDPVTVYRFHIEDPIVFKKQIRVSIEHGHANRCGDDLSSVAFWYQAEPHLVFPPLLPVEQRLPIFRKPFERRPGVKLD
jgi:hypothetical protein